MVPTKSRVRAVGNGKYATVPFAKHTHRKPSCISVSAQSGIIITTLSDGSSDAETSRRSCRALATLKMHRRHSANNTALRITSTAAV